ncbi:MAG: HAMP domain-containing histidine kinase [Acetatifactor sp.]|nr:HAMP domain-containing histidine kinase [Acetatifactor sp.]
MKLWKKISLIYSIILIVIVTVCSVILLGQVQKKILSVTRKQTEDKQWELAYSFEDMANQNFSGEDSEAVRHTLVHYCFSQYADSSSVLMIDDETVYSQSDISPMEYLVPEQQESMQQHFFGKVGGRYFLIVGSTVWLAGYADNRCVVYVVEDITPIYEDMARQLLQFILIDAVCIVGGLLLIIFFVRRFVKPLTELQATASHIAAGNYEERAIVRAGDEIGMLSADFNRMAEAVERHVNELTETAKRQQMFIGSVTHEFKTPLTALMLKIDTLKNTYMEEEERIAYLSNMERQCRWLERMVQKLLKLITLNQELTLQEVSVSVLFDQVRNAVAESLDARGIELLIDCRAKSLFLDADLMQSVLVNLVENAAKASKEGQTIILAAYGNVLEVKDCGTGIREEEVFHITEPFYMVDKSRSKKHGGVGLGLALAEKIVKEHNARLEIESTFGVGTTVRVHLQK